MLRRSLRIAHLVVAVASTRPALAGLSFPSVTETVAGARVEVAPVRSLAGGEFASLRVDVADAELYGVSGLRVSGVRACAMHAEAFASLALTQVSSPVGSHQRAVLEPGYALGRVWQGAVRVGAERLRLDTAASLTWRVAGATSRVDVGRVSVLADFEWEAGSDGETTTLSLASRVRAGAASVTGSVRIDGDRFVGACIAGMVPLNRTLALAAGYDDGSETLHAAAVIRVGCVEISAGVSAHPVLGTSQGVTIACVQ